MREKTIYVSGKTIRRLNWLRKVEATELPRILTCDEIAERLLNEKIESDFPNILTFEQKLNALEDQLVCDLLRHE